MEKKTDKKINLNQVIKRISRIKKGKRTCPKEPLLRNYFKKK